MSFQQWLTDAVIRAQDGQTENWFRDCWWSATDRCLKILEDLKALCPSQSAILDRAAERIREGT